jgi:23S rRNA G2069 N7-methylase RlmK/C1962 C5-methylase RlmI
VFRLYDRDIPEIPLVLDFYGGAVSGALYERPYPKEEAEELRWLWAMQNSVAEALEIPPAHIFLKRRRHRRGGQYERESSREAPLGAPFRGSPERGAFRYREVREGPFRFRVNLGDYLDTGLFPDRRMLRERIGRESAAKAVLNLFCYTAAFSVYAAAGKAALVDSVDISNTYLDWAKSNLELNGFPADRIEAREFFRNRAGKPGQNSRSGLKGLDGAAGDRGETGPCRLIRGDALAFLEDAAAAGRSWDLIILDPPSFSNSKKMNSTLDIRRDHPRLISQCLSLLKPGGTLYFSVNARRFSFRGEPPGMEPRDITAQLRDEDFRGKSIPPCYSFCKKTAPVV